MENAPEPQPPIPLWMQLFVLMEDQDGKPVTDINTADTLGVTLAGELERLKTRLSGEIWGIKLVRYEDAGAISSFVAWTASTAPRRRSPQKPPLPFRPN